MTWGELLQAAGGRSSGNNNHPISVADLANDAQRRLQELRLDDIDEVWSLRLSSTIRVIGIRDGRAFKALWFDRHHSVCPGVKRGS